MMASFAGYALLAAALFNTTYEYQQHPFNLQAFSSDREIESFLDGLGREGFFSSLVWIGSPFDAGDDHRFFIREVGGRGWRADYDVLEDLIPTDRGAEVWIPALHELGQQGFNRLNSFTNKQGASRMLVVRHFIGGELSLVGWDYERTGDSVFVQRASSFKAAAAKLARRGFIAIAPSILTGGELAVIGVYNHLASSRYTVKVRFKRVPDSVRISPERFLDLVNKQGRKGYRLINSLGFSDDSFMMFAREKENGRKTRQKCLLESYSPSENPESIANLLNARGAEGYQFMGGFPVGNVTSLYLLLCNPS